MTFAAFRLQTPEDAAGLGAALAGALRVGDAVGLEGPLGAGKTTLARGLVRAFAGAGDAPSPTFTLVETYDGPAFALWHFDCYRLDRAEDVWELDLEDALETGAALIEWPERIAALLPADRLTIALSIEADGARRAALSGPTDWRDRLEGFAARQPFGKIAPPE